MVAELRRRRAEDTERCRQHKTWNEWTCSFCLCLEVAVGCLAPVVAVRILLPAAAANHPNTASRERRRQIHSSLFFLPVSVSVPWLCLHLSSTLHLPWRKICVGERLLLWQEDEETLNCLGQFGSAH